MITHIRRFNELGIERFRNILHKLKEGGAENALAELIVDGNFCDIIHSGITIEQKKFDSRNEIIRYIDNKIAPIQERSLLYDAGLWSWMAAFYFDSICPERSDGTRKVGDDSRYILNPEDWKKYYRHLLASPVRLYKELKDISKIYLAGSPDKPGDLFEQLASRQEIAACKGIIEAATLLYWDEDKGIIKKGARNKEGAGILRRFANSTIPQFQMTYDLNSMRGDEILELLPVEFDKWKKVKESL